MRRALLLFLLAGCGTGLPEVSRVVDFRLTERSGRAFTLKDLRGRLFVADFVFTNCPGPCPLMTRRMKELHDRYRDEPRVRFVTFSVDPDRDTPEVLAAYADRHGADPDRWFFLTGPIEEITRVEVEGMKVGSKAVAAHHSTRFILVDERGWVRNYYDATDDERMRAIHDDIARLLRPPFQPTLHALLNAASFLCLLAGWRAIRRKAVDRHRRWMLAALACSLLFLVSYLLWHARYGSRPFAGAGALRTAYLAILLSHTVLAAALVPLVGMTVVRALKGRFEAHRRIARFTLPVWLYVSVTGVVVYWMLYLGVG
jgi:protein SCO1/2